MTKRMKVLQIGLGGFGKNHLKAWLELGFHDQLFVADLKSENATFAKNYGLAPAHVTDNYRDFIDQVDTVDIVTDTISHFELASFALHCNKNIFIEKPLTLNAQDSLKLFEVAREKKKSLQVGYYYRYHPISLKMKELLPSVGQIRYIRGEFMGFKRARNDIGVMHTDGIHFLDLCNWLLEEHPKRVVALTRDHFQRGLEDMAIGIFTYNKDVVLKIEAGYIQPGSWKDKVVPHAMTTKTLCIIGSDATLVGDFEKEQLELFHCHHKLKSGTWSLINNGSEIIPTESVDTVNLVKRELQDFLNSIKENNKTKANAFDSGFLLGKAIEAFYKSAEKSQLVEISY